MFNLIQGHFALLNDPVRSAAYERAINATVKPGSVVLDLGAGTGVMALLACRAGASRVYSIESGGMIEVVRKVAKANGYEDRVVCLHGDSQDIELPERVDVVIADQAGPFGIGGGLFGAFNDAHRRFLKPGGATIPSRIDLSVGLTEFPKGWAPVKFWDEHPLGFDRTAMRTAARNIGYEFDFTCDQLLSAPAIVVSFDLATPTPPARGGSATLEVNRRGTLHGLFASFTAELSSGVSISNSPLGPGTIDRRAWFLPIENAIAADPGDIAKVTVHILPVEEMVMWKVEVAGTQGTTKASFTHSTLISTLIAREDRERMRPDYVPHLSPAGEAKRAILELCDGRRNLREIAQEVYRQFPKNFTSLDQAAAAVSRVVLRKTI